MLYNDNVNIVYLGVEFVYASIYTVSQWGLEVQLLIIQH